MRIEPVEDLPHRRDRAGDDDVERAQLQEVFDANGEDLGWERKLFDHRLEDFGLLADRLAEGDAEVGAADGEDDAGNAAAGTEIEDARSLRELVGEFEAIANVAADELVERGMAREIKLFVPTPEGRAVAVEEFDLSGFEFDAVRAEGGGKIGVIGLRLDRRGRRRVVGRGVGGVDGGLVHEVLLREVLLRGREGLGIGQYRGKWRWGEAGQGGAGASRLTRCDSGTDMFGVININKPAGWSSRATLTRVERLVRPVKVGHAGTLDPLAEGVLVACLGPATRLIEHIQRMPKEYQATFLLGRRSPSDDVDSEVEQLVDPPTPTRAEVESLLPRFTGVIEQRPPAFSAVKIEGQRAYKLARKGRDVETSLREVEVYAIELGRYKYPEVELTIRCSGGTYVRSIGRDLAEQLGTAAVMSALVRTAIGPFRIEDAMEARSPDEERLRTHLQSPLAAIPDMPRLMLTDGQVYEVQHGGLIKGEHLPEALRGIASSAGGLIAGVDARGDLIALLKEARPGWLRPSPNFLQPA